MLKYISRGTQTFFKKHPFPSEPHSLTLLKNQLLLTRFSPGTERRAPGGGGLQLQASTESSN